MSSLTTYRACPACQARILHETAHCPNCGEDVAHVSWREGDPYVGVVLEGRYAIDGLLGIGGMGRVYRATQTSLGKPFAIKILHPHLTDDPDSRARFAAEAHNAASLNHPNVVSVVDYGRSKEGITYIVMEHVEGQTLEGIIHEQHPLPRERVLDLSLQILSALGEAHGLGILHRDLKPENIIVQQLRTHGEVLKVLDFGIAKLMEQNDARPGLTGRGMVCGTPEYMSPEQARGLTLDARSDLYAVGIILYQLLTGALPFQAESPVDLLHMQIHQPAQPPHLVAGRAPDVLDEICLRAIAKDREARFANAAEFRDALVGATPAVSSARTSCGTCGATLSTNDRFCSSCGAQVTSRARSVNSPSRRRQTRLSHTALAAGGRERTAEMIVRAFPLPLAGRDPLIHAARSRFAQPTNGLVTQILRGPPGSGRTRLLEEMLTLAESAGWRTYFVGAEPSGAAPPLWPIRHVIAEVLGVDPITVTTQELGRASNLVGLAREALPGLAELFGLGGPVHGSEYAVRRRECFASVVQTLAAAGRGAPLVLAFDDIDLYDGASRHVVQRLSRARTTSSVLVLGASSEQDLAWLNGPVLDIPALDAESVRELVREVVEAINPASTLPDVLAERAPISPLRLELQLRLLAQGASLPPRDDEAGLVHARLVLLEPIEHTMVEIGSVLGERFTESDLVHVMHALPEGVTTSSLEGALQRLHTTGMLTVAGRGERSFAHRHVRDLVYASMPGARRQLLHRLAAHHTLSAKLDITVQAMHLLKCGDPEVVEILVDAAERATRAFDDRKAVNLLRAARRAFTARVGAAQGAHRRRDHEITSRVVETLRFTGNASDAASLAEQALATHPDDDLAVGLSRSLARALSAIGRPLEAISHFQSALAGYIAAGQREEILITYAELGQAYARSGDPTRGVAELTEGLDLVSFGEGPRADVGVSMWRYLLALVDLEFARGNLREARTWCEHAIFQAELRREELGILRTHARMADTLRALDQGALAESHLGRALEEARYLGDRLTTAELLLSRGDLRLRRGHQAEARHCYDEAERLALVVDWRDGLARAHDALARIDAAS